MHTHKVVHDYFFILLFIISPFILNAEVTTECRNDDTDNVVRLRVFRAVETIETLEILNCSSKILNINQYCKPDSQIKLITHGFAETWRMKSRWDWVDVMKNELFKLSEIDKLCVIAVDWKELAAGGVVPNYWKAIANMRIAGELVADVLNNSRIDIKNVHCIGFSLGAHMCSIMYKIYFDKYRVKPGRLTGLDPAGPFFAEKSESEKINYNDADFVDVIHTSEKFGLPEQSGHMDFFTNNDISDENTCHDIKYRYNVYDKVILYEEEIKGQGTKYDELDLNDDAVAQNGGIGSLTLSSVFSSLKGFFKGLYNRIRKVPKRVFISTHQFFGCSHLMAVRHFIYSINDCVYESQYCESSKKSCKSTNVPNFPRMGYYADKSDIRYKTSFGTFYVNTSDAVPFCYDFQKGFVNKIIETLKSSQKKSKKHGK